MNTTKSWQLVIGMFIGVALMTAGCGGGGDSSRNELEEDTATGFNGTPLAGAEAGLASSAFSSLASGVASGIGSEVGGLALGWILGKVGVDPDPNHKLLEQIQSELKEISGELKTLHADMIELGAEVELSQDELSFDIGAWQLSEQTDQILTDYDTLANLQPDDDTTAFARTLASRNVPNQLGLISQAVIGNEEHQGLLEILTTKLIDSRNLSNSDPVNTYLILESYFGGLLGIEAKAFALQTEVYHFKDQNPWIDLGVSFVQPTAQAFHDEVFVRLVEAQVEEFLEQVERYAAQTVVLRGTASAYAANADVIFRRADMFAAFVSRKHRGAGLSDGRDYSKGIGVIRVIGEEPRVKLIQTPSPLILVLDVPPGSENNGGQGATEVALTALSGTAPDGSSQTLRVWPNRHDHPVPYVVFPLQVNDLNSLPDRSMIDVSTTAAGMKFVFPFQNNPQLIVVTFIGDNSSTTDQSFNVVRSTVGPDGMPAEPGDTQTLTIYHTTLVLRSSAQQHGNRSRAPAAHGSCTSPHCYYQFEPATFPDDSSSVVWNIDGKCSSGCPWTFGAYTLQSYRYIGQGSVTFDADFTITYSNDVGENVLSSQPAVSPCQRFSLSTDGSDTCDFGYRWTFDPTQSESHWTSLYAPSAKGDLLCGNYSTTEAHTVTLTAGQTLDFAYGPAMSCPRTALSCCSAMNTGAIAMGIKNLEFVLD